MYVIHFMGDGMETGLHAQNHEVIANVGPISRATLSFFRDWRTAWPVHSESCASIPQNTAHPDPRMERWDVFAAVRAGTRVGQVRHSAWVPN